MPSTAALRAAAALLASLSLAVAQNPPPGFTYETLVDGPLQSATAMAFLPDGRLLLTERATGNIRVFRDGQLLPTPWATVAIQNGGSYSEQGLLGIAVDPGFLTNRYVYIYYSAPSGTENRIGRLQDNNGTGTGLTVLTPANAIASQLYHNGGPMVFGPDGMLYVATGDAMSGAEAQDLTAWAGKVLRFQPPNLTIPANNPFPGSPVFSYGHRNQFGLCVHPITGRVYQTENGNAMRDEVNLLVAGGNYGWPIVEGPEPTPNSAYVDPLATWQPTFAPTGTCFYSGEHYPLQYKNTWFVCDYNLNRLRMLTLNAAGTVVQSQGVFDTLPGSGYGAVTGPDGNLWVLTHDTGGFGADELGRYVHANESLPSAQLSSVSNKTLGASITVGLRGNPGEVLLPWMSLARYPTPVPTPFGNLWVPGDTTLAPVIIVTDQRAYQAAAVPNAPSFLGSSLHLQAVSLSAAGLLTLSNASELVIRG
jgi:glucose/arabinose dehydrogenase